MRQVAGPDIINKRGAMAAQYLLSRACFGVNDVKVFPRQALRF